jgi:hypothetical protein
VAYERVKPIPLNHVGFVNITLTTHDHMNVKFVMDRKSAPETKIKCRVCCENVERRNIRTLRVVLARIREFKT